MVSTIPPVVLLTRRLAASQRFAAMLDLKVVISPLMETVWLSPALDRLPDAVVFTSTQGVVGFTRLQSWRGRAFCVGDRTAQIAREAGFDAVSAGGDVHDLSELLVREAGGQRLLHARGEDVAGDLNNWVTPYVVYRQAPVPLTADAKVLLAREKVVVVPLFSPRSAGRFGAILDGDCNAEIRGVAMSQNVADTAQRAGVPVVAIAASPDALSMADAVRGAAG